MTRMWRIREMLKASDGSWYCSEQYDVQDEQIEETISELEELKGMCFDSYTIDPLNEYRISYITAENEQVALGWIWAATAFEAEKDFIHRNPHLAEIALHVVIWRDGVMEGRRPACLRK